MKSASFAKTVRADGGRNMDHGLVPKTRELSCDDCFFKKNHLCALKLDGPCPTFRPAERNLAPERQLAFVFRSERTTAAYAFPQPTA
jgi:hypothetical protein